MPVTNKCGVVARLAGHGEYPTRTRIDGHHGAPAVAQRHRRRDLQFSIEVQGDVVARLGFVPIKFTLLPAVSVDLHLAGEPGSPCRECS